MNEASDWYHARRRDGVPTVITSDEAYRLTEGAIGEPGNHHSPINLFAAAEAWAARPEQPVLALIDQAIYLLPEGEDGDAAAALLIRAKHILEEA